MIARCGFSSIRSADGRKSSTVDPCEGPSNDCFRRPAWLSSLLLNQLLSIRVVLVTGTLWDTQQIGQKWLCIALIIFHYALRARVHLEFSHPGGETKIDRKTYIRLVTCTIQVSFRFEQRVLLVHPIRSFPYVTTLRLPHLKPTQTQSVQRSAMNGRGVISNHSSPVHR